MNVTYVPSVYLQTFDLARPKPRSVWGSGRLALLTFGGLATIAGLCQGQTLYTFGNPTAEEQFYLELINRARANPAAEGSRLAATTDPDVLTAYSQFGVSLSMLQSEFNALPAAPPLAPNESLITSARRHSTWMLVNATQAHNETNPANTPWDRMSAAGYTYSGAAENVYAYAKNTWFGHVGFEVDWGYDTGGMQAGRGHRANIHNPSLHEIGVGVALGTNGGIGPQLVTQDFGSQSSNPTFCTGVAYYDLNGNNTYDIGEGIAGLTVTVSGSSYYCITAAGGGWAVPVPGNSATRTVTFTGPSVNQTISLTVPASTNAKADLKLDYWPPAILSPPSALVGSPHPVAFTAVGGATGYKWNRWKLATAPTEDCDCTANITSATTGSYAVLNTSTKQQGTAAFHLENSTGASQSIQLNSLFQGQASPVISFQSSVHYATTSEQFKVQVKEDGASAWRDVFSQTGTNGMAESSFNLRSAALTGMAGKAFRVRFLLNSGGSYFGASGDLFGWFIDAIAFSGVFVLQNCVSQTLAGTSGSFTPDTGNYLMSVAPVISSLEFPPSYQTITVAVPSFTNWAANAESAAGLAAGTIANHPQADYDRDGRSNLLEYAFGTSPVLAAEAAPRMPTARLGAADCVLQYQRDTTLTDITLTAQASSDLIGWKAVGEAGAPAGFTDTVIASDGTIQTHEARIPLSSGGHVFLRVQVTQP